jgi:hypothetical protein
MVSVADHSRVVMIAPKVLGVIQGCLLQPTGYGKAEYGYCRIDDGSDYTVRDGEILPELDATYGDRPDDEV